jgi:hypothetical protein
MIDNSACGVLPNQCPYCSGKISYGKTGAVKGVEWGMLWFSIKPLLKTVVIILSICIFLAVFSRLF